MGGREGIPRPGGPPAAANWTARHAPRKGRRTAAPRALMHPGPGGAWLAGARRHANPAVPTRIEANIPSATAEDRAFDVPGAGPLLGVEFRELAARWREDTEHLSSTDVFTHPDYQRIIGLGYRVVPHLLLDLAATGAHWFWALRAITGENPVAAEDAGNVRKMIQAWLAWGEARGMV